MSRGFVEDRGLKQTPQASDEVDKKYGIWHNIFLDHVDIHDRSGRLNQYGPVLFRFDLKILLKLPAGTEILVTKKNPIYWHENEPDTDRWIQRPNELAKRIQFGNFEKMLVIETSSEKLDFPDRHARITLDDSQRETSSGEDAFTHAENRLTTAAATGGVEAHIERCKCQIGCICVAEYGKYTPGKIDLYFI
jgi:hypothetical protein